MGSDMHMPLLSLDLSPPISPSLPEFITRFLVTGVYNSGDFSKLNDYVNSLEDELKKIQAFQRELPLSFIILDDAITKLKEVQKKNEEKRWDGKLNGRVGVNLGIDEFEKKDWMSSAQLWSPTSKGGDDEPPKQKARGALLTFIEAREAVPGLSLVPPGLNTSHVDEQGSGKPLTGGMFSGSVFSSKTTLDSKPYYQTPRKRRRCWSPELHRRFVDALEQLGGSQVATPKQIRELMQVDGLTNDEVKSHLQKYRLHVRKLPAASITTLFSTDVGVDCGDQLELGCTTMDLQHSSSPKGPLHLGESRKCNSSSLEEDEEEKSDGQSWKVQHHM